MSDAEQVRHRWLLGARPWQAAVLEAARRADLYEALFQSAGSVASGVPLAQVAAGAAASVARVLGADIGLVLRRDEPYRGKLLGRHLARPVDGYPDAGQTLVFDPSGSISAAVETRLPARVAPGRPTSVAVTLGQRVAVPVTGESGVWGAITVAAGPHDRLPADVESVLDRFAELLSASILNSSNHARLLKLAASDALTGLDNRRIAVERLEEETFRAHRYQRPLSLIVFDIDHFKAVNDLWGHPVGDQVLTLLADTMRTTLRSDAVAARIGGDEFAVILPEANIDTALRVGQRLVSAVAASPVGAAGTVTISAGVAELDTGLTCSDLHLRADLALYAAKAHGRNTIRRYQPPAPNT